MFYAPNILETQVLSEEESRHAVKVLRLNLGSEIELLDGKGGKYRAKITLAHQKRCEFEIIEQLEKSVLPKSGRLHIAIAPTKSIDRFEWFIEKSTEIGVDEITPILCRFSERKTLKLERLEKIIVSASKQSQRTYFPLLNPFISFQEFINKDIKGNRFIAHCYNHSEKKKLFDICDQTMNTTILIGPEGDFSREEVEVAIKNKFTPVTISEQRLRTETAGIVACHSTILKKSCC
ncbi:MAG: 16S rRNA (uracil(1498)-N(3))-methyltransferase [Paludibacter sp.]|nr:MAG: 16S rRNA (uracil(1498)-N(3))-methyltransferase [Paludibacter sp.]